MTTVQKKQIPKKRQKKQKNKKNSNLVNWSRAGQMLAELGPIKLKG